jgi:putative ABC transport system permease protein
MTTFQDLRYAVRLLLKTPSFTLVAILTLMLGIGANVAIFSVVNGLLIKPLPYAGADRLHMVWQDLRALGGPPDEWMSPANYFDWRARAKSFEELAVYGQSAPTLTGASGEPEQLRGWTMSHGMFRVLGVAPAIGRDFTEADDRPGAPLVAIVSHGLWTRRFGEDPSLVGQTITLNREPVTVIGIMPASFRSPFGTPDLWRPVRLDPANAPRNSVFLQGIARRRTDVSVEQARAELRALGDAIAQEYPAEKGSRILLTTLHERVIGNVRTPLLALLGAVGLVLLMACANIANLLLARATARSREVAVRIAMGASPMRLVRQLLTESVVLGGAGAVSGVLLSWWLLDLLVSLSPPGTPRLDAVRVDGTALAFAASLALATSLIFGLAPAVHAMRNRVTEALNEGGRGGIGSRRALSARSAFIVVEMSLALMLLVGAGLLTRSLTNMIAVDPGFRPERLLVATVGLPQAAYREDDRVRSFFTALLDRLQAAPGVDGAGLVSVLPFSGNDTDTTFYLEGQPEPTEPGTSPTAWFRIVSPGFFGAIGMRLEAGRFIEPTDMAGTERVAVVNRALANRYFGGVNPVGRRIMLGRERPTLVIGVVADVHHRSLREDPLPQMYLSDSQMPRRMMTIVVRTSREPAALVPGLRAAVAGLDPALPVANVNTMESLVADSLAMPRLLSGLMTAFAGAALLMAAIGIYGLMSYSVSERTREFGIRSALGAGAGDVLRLVMGQTAWLTAIALTVGAAAAYGVARLIGSLLFGITANDAATFAGTALLLAVVSLAAGFVPARRATRVSPVVALRE